MKVRVVCRKIYDYIRYDLKEISFPSSLPDPPNIKKRRILTWDERIWVCPFSRFIFTFTWGVTICYFFFQFDSDDHHKTYCGWTWFYSCIIDVVVWRYLIEGMPLVYLFSRLCWETFHVQVFKRAARLYAASWVRDIGPDLRPDDYKKDDDMTDETNGEKKTTKGKESSTLEDLGTNLFSTLILPPVLNKL